jgi:UDPglucose 6-dehydrogenase
MKIAVVGSGYVGLVSAACFAEIGHNVVSIDNDPDKIAALGRGEVPIHELHLSELLDRHRGHRLRFSTGLGDSIRDAEAIFITVGTPQSETGEADLSYVESVAREMASALRGQQLVVEKSTVPVNTCDSLRRALVLNGAPSQSFSVASNPEFLREGTAVIDFLYPDRIVIGADDEFSRTVLSKIYAPLANGTYYRQREAIRLHNGVYDRAPIIVTNAKSAELTKHASNAFLAMKISFINAVANISESVGADIQQVCAGIGSDSRIGPKFLNAGIGYGGSCFPKDVQAFRMVSEQCNYEFGLLKEVTKINTEQQRLFVKKVQSALWTLRGKKLGVLGLAFKGETDDVRESPAIAIVNALVKEGATARAYDPAAMRRAADLLPKEGMTFASNAYDAAIGCDALLILTEWREFATLDLERVRRALRHPIVVDGRNLLDPEKASRAGLIYYSIGRPACMPDRSLLTGQEEDYAATSHRIESPLSAGATS